MLQLLSVWSYLCWPRTPFKVICHHYTFTSHSAITRADIRMDEFNKCSTRTMFLKEIRDWICLSCPHWGDHFHSLDTVAILKVQIYCKKHLKQSVEKKLTFLSKLLLRIFSSDYCSQICLQISAVLIPWSWPNHMHFSHVGMEEDGCRWLIVQRSCGHPSHKQARHIYLQEKKLNRRCFTVQVSEWSSNVNPLHVSREGLGHEPCFYLSPSSSEVTKAKEELFRALTDMFSSCRAGLAGRHAQKLYQVNDMMWSHCQPALPYVRAPLLTVLTEMCCFGKTQLSEMWDYCKHKDLN